MLFWALAVKLAARNSAAEKIASFGFLICMIVLEKS